MDTLKISPSEFLLRISKSRADIFVKSFESLGTIERVPTTSGLFLLRLRKRNGLNPKQAWDLVRDFLTKQKIDSAIIPVFIDDDQNPSYSTGAITIRFKEPPSDAWLAEFGIQHSLKVSARNSFIPAQISFEASDTNQFLPNLLDDIKSSSEIVSVWPETLSFFQRG